MVQQKYQTNTKIQKTGSLGLEKNQETLENL